jgi:SAM-dependent methyltransferase
VQVTRSRLTGAGDPTWSYPQKDLTGSVLAEPFANAWPYSAKDFVRLDEEPDPNFYRFPKLVYHIDEGAVAALTHYYDRAIPDGSDILDICSSWVSHYPRSFPSRMKSIVGTGISQTELACNDQLTGFLQADLNAKPRLNFPDRSFDVVTCVVSFDYLTKPLEVMKECARVLRPGGKIILSQSNRCFFTKAVVRHSWPRRMPPRTRPLPR